MWMAPRSLPMIRSPIPRPAASLRFGGHQLRTRLRVLRSQRGFTLIEMLAVVIIITVLAVMAIPSVSHQLRDRRTYEAAQRVALLYQNARMRAMGRGSAVMIRFHHNAGERARFDVFEAQRGTSDAPSGSSDAACAALPIPSCLTPDWNSPTATDYRMVNQVRFGTSGAYDELNTTLVNSTGAQTDTLDVCFTPMGRTYARTSGTLEPLTEAYVAEMFRGEDLNQAVGRSYKVLILPTGAARILQ
jgi:prepilin-type N-terminal cleavage/methylation domain-containing protein